MTFENSSLTVQALVTTTFFLAGVGFTTLILRLSDYLA